MAIFNGNDDDNIINGTAEADVINGGGGEDLLVGEGGADILYGDEGDDILWSAEEGSPDLGLEKDMLFGGGGGDRLAIGLGDDADGGDGFDLLALTFLQAGGGVQLDTASIVSGGAVMLGNSHIGGIEAVSSIVGSAFDDIISVAAQRVLFSVEGGAGNDVFVAENDGHSFVPEEARGYLYGGQGDDRYISSGAGIYFDGGEGFDTLDFGAALFPIVRLQDGQVSEILFAEDAPYEHEYIINVEGIEGSATNDEFYGNSQANIIRGKDGDDMIEGRGGDDFLDGGAGSDLIDGGAGHDVLLGGDGDDWLAAGNDDSYLEGGEGDDIIEGGTVGVHTAGYRAAVSAVTVNLAVTKLQDTKGAGNDLLIGIRNIDGSDFADTLAGNSLANVIQGLAGADTINGQGGNDTIGGGDGDDKLYGGIGNDVLHGDAGADVLTGGTGENWLHGGEGSDTAAYDTAAAGVRVDLDLAGSFQDTGAGRDILFEIENLTGSAHADMLFGSSGTDNVINGGNGKDVIDGRGGSDTLNGGAGDDLILSGAGNDRIDGGVGIDTLDYSARGGAVVVNLGIAAGQDTLAGGKDIIKGIENLVGTAFADILTGTATGNEIQGGDGADLIAGGAGHDVLRGGDGNDRLTGDAGADQLYGGLGADVFRFVSTLDSAVDPLLRDTVFDFSRAEGDKIGLASIDANSKTTVVDDAFKLVASFGGVAGQLVVNAGEAAGTYRVAGDVNGDGVADFAVLVHSATALVASDFVL